RGGQFREVGGRPGGAGRDRVAREQPVGADGRRAGHPWYAAAERRHRRLVQLARTDTVRPGAEAGPGGSRKPYRVDRGGGVSAVDELLGPSRRGERAKRLYAIVRNEHGHWRCQWCRRAVVRTKRKSEPVSSQSPFAADKL